MPKEHIQPKIPELSEAQRNPVFWLAYNAYLQLKDASITLGEPVETDGERYEAIYLTRPEVQMFTDILTNHPDVYTNTYIQRELKRVQHTEAMDNCFVELRYDRMPAMHSLYVSISMKSPEDSPFYVASVAMKSGQADFEILTHGQCSDKRTATYGKDVMFIRAIGAISRMRRDDADTLIHMTPANS